MNGTVPSPEFEEAVAAACHGTATGEQLRALNHVLRTNPEARDAYLLRVELHARLASDPDLFLSPDAANPAADAAPSRQFLPPQPAVSNPAFIARWRTPQTLVLAIAACLALMLAGAGWWRRNPPTHRPEATSRAVAMLARAVNARWSSTHSPPQLGSPLEPGLLRLESGLVQIVFYNGARVALEGPAEIRLVTSSSADGILGRLTAEVPPQARDFRISTPVLAVTAPGTSFGLNLGRDRTELHAFEGTVRFHTRDDTIARSLDAGSGVVLEGTRPPSPLPAHPSGFDSLFALQTRSVAADSVRYQQWRRANQQRRQDSSLWVHFDFEHGSASDWRLPNNGSLSGTVPDATIVGCQWQEGRWASKPALEFRGVSDRVRLNVPGPCEALTLAAWVRIQGLDRPINSLFMSDGFLPGTVHWVIRDDGALGLTVIGPGGHHQILASPPVMTVDQFGIWTHLAVVLNPGEQRATHYVNGQPVSRHRVRIAPPFEPGAAELGNWNAVGFPGDDPFLIRNFSGVLDEFSLYGRALDDAEIESLYAQGRPQSDPPASARP
ncbi:MAG: FecR domain-containing protein [Verrucomicrobiales bacterium]|nr:FecR domain-containing protein [Verrucomicrobiales bacterium]